MAKVDLKDRRILHELDHNARIPFSKLGRKIGLSESVVRYRVDRLLSSGVLRGFLTFIDSPKLGYHFHTLFIKLKVISEAKERDIIERLKRHPSVCWLCSTSGPYHLIVSMLVRDAHHLLDVQNDIARIVENCIVEDSLFIATTACQLPYPLLPGQKRDVIEKTAQISAAQKMRLDRIDLKILELLSLNSRVTALELSEKLGLCVGAVSERYDRLVSSDLVQGFKPSIDMSKLGKQWYVVLFKLKYVDVRMRNSFVEYLKSLPQTFFVVNGVGNWGMQVEFYCDDDREFRQVLNRIFPSQKSDIIKEHAELRVNEEHKCVFYPFSIAGDTVQASLDLWCTVKKSR